MNHRIHSFTHFYLKQENRLLQAKIQQSNSSLTFFFFFQILSFSPCAISSILCSLLRGNIRSSRSSSFDLLTKEKKWIELNKKQTFSFSSSLKHCFFFLLSLHKVSVQYIFRFSLFILFVILLFSSLLFSLRFTFSFLRSL